MAIVGRIQYKENFERGSAREGRNEYEKSASSIITTTTASRESAMVKRDNEKKNYVFKEGYGVRCLAG